ncbi:hypothetical protein [Clostridium sp. B9]|uniref:hypothetical protein n=1 Tax=Clostridium sp. B9 TaxID=3423224 RepID=UPI003D2F363D
MSRIDKVLNICEKSLEYRDYHEYILGIIKKCTESKLDNYDECKDRYFEKDRKLVNINYLLEQKKLDFLWKMNRIFQGLEEEELKFIRKNAEMYELKRLANFVIKEKINEN